MPNDRSCRPTRILIIGCSGSGKSTLSAVLARTCGLPFFPTDGVYWRPDWTPVPADDVRAWVEGVTANRAWVLDGNFDAQRDVVWARAEMIVWLDLPKTKTLWRVLQRNLRWWVMRTPIWGGLRMTYRTAIDGLRHAARSHAIKREAYPDMLAAFPHLQVVHIRSDEALGRWINDVKLGALHRLS